MRHVLVLLAIVAVVSFTFSASMEGTTTTAANPECGCGHCATVDGPTTAVCSACNGSGNGPFQCFSCKGTGKNGSFTCSFCNGRGRAKCSTCNGSGQR